MHVAKVAVVALLALNGCGGGNGDGVGTSATSLTTASTRPAITTSTSTTIGMLVVPNVVGKTLAEARSTFAAAGFNRITANDGTQRKRTPADDWVVFRQSPAGGERLPTSVYMYLELLQRGERFVNPGTSPCPRLVQC